LSAYILIFNFLDVKRGDVELTRSMQFLNAICLSPSWLEIDYFYL